MAAYFASDVHLRLECPERGRRFARFVDGLEPDDTLTIVGDLCDFWFASRQVGHDPRLCDGLRALAAFRARGGDLTILPGNHDLWLGPFYEQALGARFLHEPQERTVHGLRLLLVHGHLLGARPFWKEWLESRRFLEAFRRLPGPMAHGLDRILNRTNSRRFAADADRHEAVFRQFVAGIAGRPIDLVVLGHLHKVINADESTPRFVVLGGWFQQSSYLRIDRSGASLIVEPDPPLSSVEPSGPSRHAEIRPSPAHRPPFAG